MGALAERPKSQIVSMLESKTKQVATWKNKATGVMPTALNLGAMGAGAWAGGLLDGYMMDDEDDQEPSTFIGVGLIVAGAFMESPTMMYTGGGMLLHFARENGIEMGDKWASGKGK
jgi:hypothetical protein